MNPSQWLKNDLEEATDAVALGGAGMKYKWATPDVIGVYRSLASQLIKFAAEIVAATRTIRPSVSRIRVRTSTSIMLCKKSGESNVS